jgi:hypothetical protein
LTMNPIIVIPLKSFESIFSNERFAQKTLYGGTKNSCT